MVDSAIITGMIEYYYKSANYLMLYDRDKWFFYSTIFAIGCNDKNAYLHMGQAMSSIIKQNSKSNFQIRLKSFRDFCYIKSLELGIQDPPFDETKYFNSKGELMDSKIFIDEIFKINSK